MKKSILVTKLSPRANPGRWSRVRKVPHKLGLQLEIYVSCVLYAKSLHENAAFLDRVFIHQAIFLLKIQEEHSISALNGF